MNTPEAQSNNKSPLNNVSLGPRDCLSLWTCMKKLESAEYALPSSLDPNNALPAADAVRKPTVVQWEAALKAELDKWMTDPGSPFDALRDQLRSERYLTQAPLGPPRPALGDKSG
ncbi:hypothetical protein B0T24DRAFT_707794 [Lasiosphaeria ovina]|uniref:Uncharacterized protein n=1 Tax=Lasiosphaeria ovina TaxID=92902 RepID=A0AAE0K3G1_9PEZI|nr:hypothetical protein B0T24DRAFT_707794 [Lasiosphaeria ovina]